MVQPKAILLTPDPDTTGHFANALGVRWKQVTVTGSLELALVLLESEPSVLHLVIDGTDLPPQGVASNLPKRLADIPSQPKVTLLVTEGDGRIGDWQPHNFALRNSSGLVYQALVQAAFGFRAEVLELGFTLNLRTGHVSMLPGQHTGVKNRTTSLNWPQRLILARIMFGAGERVSWDTLVQELYSTDPEAPNENRLVRKEATTMLNRLPNTIRMWIDKGDDGCYYCPPWEAREKMS